MVINYPPTSAEAQIAPTAVGYTESVLTR